MGSTHDGSDGVILPQQLSAVFAAAVNVLIISSHSGHFTSRSRGGVSINKCSRWRSFLVDRADFCCDNNQFVSPTDRFHVIC